MIGSLRGGFYWPPFFFMVATAFPSPPAIEFDSLAAYETYRAKLATSSPSMPEIRCR